MLASINEGSGGAAASYVGFGLPAFCLMLVFAVLYAQTGSLPAVDAVFSGLQAVVVAIVVNAAFSFGKTTLKHWMHWLIALVSAALFWQGLNSLVVILAAAATGWLFLPQPDFIRTQASPPPGASRFTCDP